MSQRAFDEHLYKVGKGWIETVRVLGALSKEGILVGRLVLKNGLADDSGTFMVVTALVSDTPMVAFHNVDDLATCWIGFSNRVKNGSLKWKDDQYAGNN